MAPRKIETAAAAQPLDDLSKKSTRGPARAKFEQRPPAARMIKSAPPEAPAEPSVFLRADDIAAPVVKPDEKVITPVRAERPKTFTRNGLKEKDYLNQSVNWHLDDLPRQDIEAVRLVEKTEELLDEAEQLVDRISSDEAYKKAYGHNIDPIRKVKERILYFKTQATLLPSENELTKMMLSPSQREAYLGMYRSLKAEIGAAERALKQRQTETIPDTDSVFQTIQKELDAEEQAKDGEHDIADEELIDITDEHQRKETLFGELDDLDTRSRELLQSLSGRQYPLERKRLEREYDELSHSAESLPVVGLDKDQFEKLKMTPAQEEKYRSLRLDVKARLYQAKRELAKTEMPQARATEQLDDLDRFAAASNAAKAPAMRSIHRIDVPMDRDGLSHAPDLSIPEAPPRYAGAHGFETGRTAVTNTGLGGTESFMQRRGARQVFERQNLGTEAEQRAPVLSLQMLDTVRTASTIAENQIRLLQENPGKNLAQAEQVLHDMEARMNQMERIQNIGFSPDWSKALEDLQNFRKSVYEARNNQGRSHNETALKKARSRLADVLDMSMSGSSVDAWIQQRESGWGRIKAGIGKFFRSIFRSQHEIANHLDDIPNKPYSADLLEQAYQDYATAQREAEEEGWNPRVAQSRLDMAGNRPDISSGGRSFGALGDVRDANSDRLAYAARPGYSDNRTNAEKKQALENDFFGEEALEEAEPTQDRLEDSAEDIAEAQAQLQSLIKTRIERYMGEDVKQYFAIQLGLRQSELNSTDLANALLASIESKGWRMRGPSGRQEFLRAVVGVMPSDDAGKLQGRGLEQLQTAVQKYLDLRQQRFSALNKTQTLKAA